MQLELEKIRTRVRSERETLAKRLTELDEALVAFDRVERLMGDGGETERQILAYQDGAIAGAQASATTAVVESRRSTPVADNLAKIEGEAISKYTSSAVEEPAEIKTDQSPSTPAPSEPQRTRVGSAREWYRREALAMTTSFTVSALIRIGLDAGAPTMDRTYLSTTLKAMVSDGKLRCVRQGSSHCEAIYSPLTVSEPAAVAATPAGDRFEARPRQRGNLSPINPNVVTATK